MIDPGKSRIRGKENLSLFVATVCVFAGITILGQGCADMERYILESQREHKLKQQLRFAEDELKKGNLVAAKTLLDWVRKESKRPSSQERALFFTGFALLLNKNDKYRWAEARKVFLRVSEEYPEGEFSQISEYVAAGLSDALRVTGSLQGDIESIRKEIDLERSNTGEKERLLGEQKRELLTKTEDIAALKDSIQKKNKEIQDLKLQIKKLEEIHKEIKKKREELS